MGVWTYVFKYLAATTRRWFWFAAMVLFERRPVPNVCMNRLGTPVRPRGIITWMMQVLGSFCGGTSFEVKNIGAAVLCFRCAVSSLY